MKPRLRLDAWEDYANGTRGEHFEWWASEYLVLGQSQWSGRSMVLERDWQAPIMYESLAVDVAGLPYWRTILIEVPRKCAKTSTLGAYADYKLDLGDGDPEILLAAGSNKQAGRLFDAAAGFIRRSGLDHRRGGNLVVRDYVGEIARVDGAGKLYRLSAEGDFQHGANPSLVVIDELHVWRKTAHRRLWGALTTADGARNDAQVFVITTEGEAAGREQSLLGQLVDTNESSGVLERHPGVTISRDHESRTIVFRFHAVDAKAADPRPLRRAIAAARQKPTKKAEREVARLERLLVRSVMPANPASWISEDYILGQARSAKVMPADFLQLHAGIAADTVERWIPAEQWNAQPLAGEVDSDARVVAAVDAALSHDSTAVSWAWETPDGVAVRSYVWSARQGSAFHEYVPGGRIRNGPVKQFLRELAGSCWLAAVLYDPKFFEDAAMELADEGLNMVQLAQNGGDMREAENQFYVAVNEAKVPHDRDEVLATHVKSVVASQTDGRWKIRKMKQSDVIDAATASIMARWGFEHVAVPYSGPLVEVLA